MKKKSSASAEMDKILSGTGIDLRDLMPPDNDVKVKREAEEKVLNEAFRRHISVKRPRNKRQPPKGTASCAFDIVIKSIEQRDELHEINSSFKKLDEKINSRENLGLTLVKNVLEKYEDELKNYKG